MRIRATARAVVFQVVIQVGFSDPSALRKALSKAYPFEQRSGYPYAAWLAEIKVQIGGMRPAKSDPRQLQLF